MAPDIELLLKFVAVAEDLSFSRASERLRISQPSLSRQISKLESQLGFSVFERTTRQVKLTKKGQRLFDRAQTIAEDYKLTQLVANSLAHDTPARLRIGMPYYAIFVDERLKLLHRFTSKHAGIDLELRLGSTNRLLRDVKNGELDACFVAYESGETEFESVTLCKAGIDIVLAAADPLAKKDSLSLSDLMGRTLSTFARTTDKTTFDQIFGIFDTEKAPPQSVTLSYTRVLKEGKSFSALPGWAHIVGGNNVRRPLKKSPLIKLQFVRLKGLASAPLDELWRTAKEIAV